MADRRARMVEQLSGEASRATKAGRHNDAAHMFVSLLATGKSADLHCKASMAYANAKNYSTALTHARAAVELDGTWNGGVPHNRLGIALFGLECWNDARYGAVHYWPCLHSGVVFFRTHPLPIHPLNTHIKARLLICVLPNPPFPPQIHQVGLHAHVKAVACRSKRIDGSGEMHCRA
jgi:hypothetical protein